MEANLTRTAFSPIVYESKDFCAALLDTEGNMIGQAMGSLPVFLCDLGNAIQDIRRLYGLDGIAPGDMFAANDPNVFGQHLNNVVVTLPIFWEGRVVAFVAVRAHWVDIGGRDPGGWNADTTEIWQEGLQIPTVKLVKRGVMDDELARLIALNVRTPEPVFGDLRAQIAACHLGARRFRLMLEKYGLETVYDCIHTIWEQSRPSPTACTPPRRNWTTTACARMCRCGCRCASSSPARRSRSTSATCRRRTRGR
jgi:N-methylhydantoinase B